MLPSIARTTSRLDADPTQLLNCVTLADARRNRISPMVSRVLRTVTETCPFPAAARRTGVEVGAASGRRGLGFRALSPASGVAGAVRNFEAPALDSAPVHKYSAAIQARPGALAGGVRGPARPPAEVTAKQGGVQDPCAAPEEQSSCGSAPRAPDCRAFSSRRGSPAASPSPGLPGSLPSRLREYQGTGTRYKHLQQVPVPCYHGDLAAFFQEALERAQRVLRGLA